MYQRPADHDTAVALATLMTALDHVAICHELRPGDLLLADNRRTVHGRSAFHYDGTDRWLPRAMTCASLQAQRRRDACRAIA